MRLIAIVGFCLAGWWSALAETPSLLPYKSAHWKQTVIIGATAVNTGQKVEAELWFLKPDNMRVVTAVEGKKQVIVIKSGTALVFEDGGTMGMKMPLKQQMLDQLAQYTEVFAKLDTWKKAKTGAEKLGDKACEIYGFTDKSGGQTATGRVWLWTEKNFPMRMVLEAQGQSVTIEHSDVQVNEAVPPAMFEAPAGMKFMDLPSAPGK
jgi:outer membrane lipoprotein-sorting protein